PADRVDGKNPVLMKAARRRACRLRETSQCVFGVHQHRHRRFGPHLFRKHCNQIDTWIELRRIAPTRSVSEHSRRRFRVIDIDERVGGVHTTALQMESEHVERWEHCQIGGPWDDGRTCQWRRQPKKMKAQMLRRLLRRDDRIAGYRHLLQVYRSEKRWCRWRRCGLVTDAG